MLHPDSELEGRRPGFRNGGPAFTHYCFQRGLPRFHQEPRVGVDLSPRHGMDVLDCAFFVLLARWHFNRYVWLRISI